MNKSVSKRRKAYGFGLQAETLAAWFLRFKGYKILARRFRGPGGEVDLIARRGATVAFVEVKAREKLEDAAHTILPRQRLRIEAAARAFLAQNGAMMQQNLRFDVILVAPRRFPAHIIGAWRPQD